MIKIKPQQVLNREKTIRTKTPGKIKTPSFQHQEYSEKQTPSI